MNDTDETDDMDDMDETGDARGAELAVADVDSDIDLAAGAPSRPLRSAGTAAQRALAFEHRVRTLPAEIDASWEREFRSRSPALSLLPTAAGMQSSAFEGILRRFCGPMPTLERLMTDAAQIALMQRPVMLRALGLLALARRPGVLRCCVDRSQKEQLQHNLGDALDAVEALGASGRAVSHEATVWTPLHWSCLGYLDWLALMTHEDLFLRRLVRLLLPRGLLDMAQRLHLARADMAAHDAVTRLGAAGVRWPC